MNCIAIKRWAIILTASCCAGSLYGQVSRPALTIQEEFRRQLGDFSPRFAALSDSSRHPSRAVGAEPNDTGTKRKSSAKALLLSAVVPGAGQFYLGQKSRARFFFAGEALSWIGYASFRLFGHWREEDMIRFARQRAGADLSGKSERFQDIVGFYWDIDQYNSLGRAYDPQRAYLPDTPENHWRWQDPADQVSYRLLKNRSRGAFDRARLMIGVMVVNRALSVIDTYRELRHRNSRKGLSSSLTDLGNYSLDFDPFGTNDQVTLTWHAPF